MPTTCVVYGCSNRHKRGNNKKFFLFPSARHQERRRKLWIAAIRRVDRHGQPWMPSQQSRVCSDHFITGMPSKYSGHPDYVPNKFIYSRTISNTSRFERLKKRLRTVQQKVEEGRNNGDASIQEPENCLESLVETPECLAPYCPPDNSEETQVTPNCHGVSNMEREVAETLLLLSAPATEDNGFYLLKQEVEDLQNENWHLKREIRLLKRTHLSIENIENDDNVFKFDTGLANVSVFNSLLLYLQEKAETLTYWYGKKSENSSNLSFEHRTRRKTSFNRQTSMKEEFFMVLVRIRTGMPTQEVARNFKVTKSTFSSIFTTWIMFLAQELKSLTNFPSLEEVRQHLPSSFAEFGDTRLVLDATEVRIQRPSIRSAQKKTFSNYKHFNTFKVLVGCTPDGYLSFVSSLWSGAVSDKELVQKCGLLEQLVPGDALMADKGFVIDDILPPGIKLHIPTFHYVKNGQMPKDDLLKTKKIASARVHVERLIRRIKEFHILDKPFPLIMADIAQEVFHVCSFLVNFQGPLIVQK